MTEKLPKFKIELDLVNNGWFWEIKTQGNVIAKCLVPYQTKQECLNNLIILEDAINYLRKKGSLDIENL